jgi:hypothetical protein
MTSSKKNMPDFFEDNSYDPMKIATGYADSSPSGKPEPSSESDARLVQPRGKFTANPVQKKKVGFYLSADILDRFTRKVHELKLAGAAVDNKSTLLELTLAFALDDLDQGTRSRIQKTLGS